MRLTSGHLYEFGPFVLDTAQHLLLREGNPVPLTPKTYDLLLVLVESRGRMILKDELIKSVWADSFVEESNLTQQISAVRKALGESAGRGPLHRHRSRQGLPVRRDSDGADCSRSYPTGRLGARALWLWRALWPPS